MTLELQFYEGSMTEIARIDANFTRICDIPAQYVESLIQTATPSRKVATILQINIEEHHLEVAMRLTTDSAGFPAHGDAARPAARRKTPGPDRTCPHRR
jgi:hypothetical protein